MPWGRKSNEHLWDRLGYRCPYFDYTIIIIVVLTTAAWVIVTSDLFFSFLDWIAGCILIYTVSIPYSSESARYF